MKKILLILAIIASIGFVIATSYVYQIDEEACTQCGICYPVCPDEAIVFNHATFTYSIDPEKCTACGICFNTCNNGAINLVTSTDPVPQLTSVKVYPNPASEVVKIEIDESERNNRESKIEIYNLKGQCIRTIESKDTTSTWNLNDSEGNKVQTGVYFVRTSIGKKYSVKKISVIK